MLNFLYKDIQDYMKFWEEWFQKKKERKTRVILLIMLVVNNLEKVPQGLQ